MLQTVCSTACLNPEDVHLRMSIFLEIVIQVMLVRLIFFHVEFKKQPFLESATHDFTRK
jgi:hypothetical protein